ncbi:transglycosylase SLT domain-containing protein [Mycobacterium sp. SP-6446]|uniref:transglycosylase SLT domain-containing protein n=1 Tax=Mycobacterium sp. SP-6446 TaxID=1834162 RepID=UPI00158A7FC9|nr:transglycosylase SLT domain-containing protein [Mycobacterium sp. SP-6446]
MATVSNTGQAASAFNNESTVVDVHIAELGEQDVAASKDLIGAMDAARAGRDQMDAVIAAAVGDITRLASATTTLAGQQALVNALARRLEQTWQTMTNGNADASTRAAASAQLAAAYSGVGNNLAAGIAPTEPMGTMAPMASALPMQNASMLASATMAANQAAMSAATQLSNMQQSASGGGGQAAKLTSATPGQVSSAAAIPVSSVQYNRSGFAKGQSAYVSYINQTLDKMGITDKTARSNWMSGLLVGLSRESGYNPLSVNDWDSNAHGPKVADGYPSGCSRGGLQTIPTTFAAHHQPGTSTNIYDPIANTAAAMNYLMSRYHVARDGSNLAAVGQFNPHHAPGGY